MRQLTRALTDAREGTGQVKAALLSASFRPRLPGLTKIVSKLSKEGSWRKALEVYEAVEEMGLQIDTALTNSAISACDKGGNWQKALEIFDRMDSLGLPRDAITYSATISSLSKGKQWQAALQIFDHMRTARVPADVVTCCSLINALERGGKWELAEKLFLEMCCFQDDDDDVGMNGTFQLSNDVCNQSGLMRSQTSPSSMLFALRAHGSIGYQGSTLSSVEEELNEDGRQIQPLALDLSLSAQDSILDSLIHDKSNADTRNSNNYITNHSETYDVESADELLSSAFARATSLRLPGQDGLDRDTLSPLSNPQNTQITPQRSITSSSHLQRGSLSRGASLANGPDQAAAAANLRRAMSCFPEFDASAMSKNPSGSSMFNFSHAAGVAPNRVCCNALLAAYARAKPAQFQKAIHLLHSMWSGGNTLVPDTVSYNTVLKACVNAFQLSKAVDVYKEMRRSGINPNPTTLTCLIAAASDASNVHVLKQIGEWLDECSVDVQVSCMNGYISGLSKAGLWHDAVARFHCTLSSNSPVHPTIATFNTIMSGYMSQGDYNGVQLTFEAMRAMSTPPNIVSFNILLSALEALGNWSMALDVLNAALHSMDGIHVSTVTFNAVLGALSNGASAADERQHPFLASQGVQVYQKMCSIRGACSPDTRTFCLLISILNTTRHSAQILAIYSTMVSHGHTPDCATANIVLSAAISLGQIAKAVQLAQSMLKSNIYIEPHQMTAMLTACAAAGAWDLAIQLCSGSLNSQSNMPSAPILFNYVLQSAMESGDVRPVIDVMTAMQAKSMELNNISGTALSNVFGGQQRESGGYIRSGTAHDMDHHSHAVAVMFNNTYDNNEKNGVDGSPVLSSPSRVGSRAPIAAAKESSTLEKEETRLVSPITPQITQSDVSLNKIHDSEQTF